MKSLGVIETRGLVAAIQAVDAACKSAGVSCIGYRKIGSGLVSVCFEGEISAIHTAIERGVEVVAAGQVVGSLVIARPERSVVDALGKLKGRPSRPAAKAEAPAAAEADALLPPQEKEPAAPCAAQPVADQAEDKNAAQRRGKKA